MEKLGAVCIQITDGSHNPPSGVEQSEYLMLSSKNIDDDFITLDSPRFLSYSDYIAENKRTTVSEGDLLMTIVGTIGRVAIVPEELKGICLQRSVAVIKPEREVVNNRYLMYQLQNMRPFLEKEARGVAQKGIYLKQVSQLDIKLPEIEQQKQIVKVLDKVSKLISLRKQQLAKLDELVKARFVEMFGDPVTNPKGYEKYKLENLARKISDGVHSKPDYTETGRPFLSVVNINKGVINFKNCKYVSEDAYQKMIKSTHPERGDVLYTKVGATYGIPAYVDTDIAFCLYVSVCLIKPKREVINPRFLSLSMEMPYVKHQADRRIKGIGVPDLHLNQISEFEILCPPLKEQDIFIYFVERLDGEKRVVQQSLEKLELMKKALMQEYFG